MNPALLDTVWITRRYAYESVAHFDLSRMPPVKVRRFAIGGLGQMLIWNDLDQDQWILASSSVLRISASQSFPDCRAGDIYSPRVSRQEARALAARFAAVDHR